MTRILICALLASATAVNSAAIAQWKRPRPPQIEGCATSRQIIEAEAARFGNHYTDAHIFHGTDAVFLSSRLGLAYPGVSTVVVVAYSDGSAGIFSSVAAPECWRAEFLERRK